jgi:hypothetical protein
LCKNKLKGAAPMGKFFVKAKTNNQKGATPMAKQTKTFTAEKQID